MPLLNDLPDFSNHPLMTASSMACGGSRRLTSRQPSDSFTFFV